MEEEKDPTEQAAELVSRLAEFMPTADEIAAGTPFPEFLAESWMESLTDPNDPDFLNAIIKAEVWLATH